jgi:hypothetical protein
VALSVTHTSDYGDAMLHGRGADFRQIHLCAPDAQGDLAEAWTAKAADDRIAAAGDIVGISIVGEHAARQVGPR